MDRHNVFRNAGEIIQMLLKIRNNMKKVNEIKCNRVEIRLLVTRLHGKFGRQT